MLSCPVSVVLCGCWEMKLPVVYFVCSLIACWPYWNVKKATESSSGTLFSFISQVVSQDCSNNNSAKYCPMLIFFALVIGELLHAYVTKTAALL